MSETFFPRTCRNLFSNFCRTWTRWAIIVFDCRNDHVPTHAWLFDGLHDWLRTPPKFQLHIDWTAHFSVGCCTQARILGRAGVQIATLQKGSHHLVSISVKSANLCFVCNACEEWRVCGQAWQCPHCTQPPILSAMVGLGESIHMAEYRSLSQKIATDFEFLGIYDSMSVFCWPRLRIKASDYAGYYSDLLYNYGLPISCRNQARFVFVFLVCFIACLKVVFDIYEQQCRPRSLNLVAYLSFMVCIKE